MMLKKLFCFYVLFVFFISCNLESKHSADTVILNANVYTLSWDDPSKNGIPAKNAPFKNGVWKFDAEAIVE